jgi:hypothetical protein
MNGKKRAQAINIYALTAIVSVVAISTMGVYLKRGLQGRYRDGVDSLTSQIGADAQYEPDYEIFSYTDRNTKSSNEVDYNKGAISRTIGLKSQSRTISQIKN